MRMRIFEYILGTLPMYILGGVQAAGKVRMGPENEGYGGEKNLRINSQDHLVRMQVAYA